MTEESNLPQRRPITLSPWIVVIGALILYGATLNHWVSLSSLGLISKITGWDWHPLPLPWRPTANAPLFLVLTLPIRILPVSLQPIALNAFSALCAALVLGLLAASVRLLPHDRTREQRQREGGEYALLSVPAAFLPPLLAVLMLGMQLTFWRHAIVATGEMLNLLIFAFLVYCLLRFRIHQNDNWLFAFAFVYGLGASNDWALYYKGYFLPFLVALVWIKGVNFFSWRFLLRMAGWGAAGLLLYLLIPAIGALGSDRGDFLGLLKMELQAQSYNFRVLGRWVALIGGVPTVLPLIFAGIKWASFQGEVSAVGSALTKYMFRLLHIVFLGLGMIMFFNLKYSPSIRLQDFTGYSFLTFYFLAALSIGYYSGYILLVFGKQPAQSWERPGPLGKIVNWTLVGAFVALAIVAPCALARQNFSSIQEARKGVVTDYVAETLRDLPDKPAILLSDDPGRLYLIQSSYVQQGKADRNILIDTSALPYKEYIAYLVSQYPELKKVVTSPEKLVRVLPSESLVVFLMGLNKTYPIYYLHPSFGYYFEQFYLKPRGLVYEMQEYPAGTFAPPPLTEREIAENQQVWARIDKQLPAAMPETQKLDPDTATAGFNYSLALDYWGVALQKAGHLKEAHSAFGKSLELYPQNYIAKINQEYNEQLQKNDPQPLDTKDLAYRVLLQYRGYKYLGPVDEPGLDMAVGEFFAAQKDFRSATALFQRALDLLPDNPEAELDMAKVFVDMNLPDKAREFIRKLRANPKADQWEVTRIEALTYYAKDDYGSAEQLMREGLKGDPQNVRRVAVMAEFYRVTAYAAMKKRPEEANRRFKNALNFLDQEVALLKNTEVKTSDQAIPDALMNKAEVQMMLKDFPSSITTLNQVIDLQPENQTALLNRAIAENQLHQFQASKRDYNALRRLMRQQPWVIEYGLAQIALEEKNPADEIRHLKRYLDSAPDDTQEYQQVRQRLRKLESR